MMENEEDDTKLSQLIDGVVTSIQTGTKCERANQIHNAVEVHLKTWLDEVEKLNPLFKVSELIQVGSYAEGTKIIQPDEFDFLAVIEDLSKPNSVSVDKSESNLQQNLVRVAIADDRLKSRWNALCKNGHLQCFQRVNFPDLGKERFGHVFISVLKEKVKEFRTERKMSRLKYSVGSPFDIWCEISLPVENSISLLLKGAEYNTPNVLIHFELENREITVDLSPAIRYHKIDDCFKVEDCAGPAFAELVLSRKSLLFVGTSDKFDFKVTVTEAEVQYMLSVMKPEHKVIYIFLKYIKNLYSDSILSFTSFTSYMLKSVCIHHDVKCKTEAITVATCLKAVIAELEECTRMNNVWSIVNRHLCLYFKESIYGSSELVEQNRKCMLDGIREICQLVSEVGTVEEFDASINDKVLQDKFKKENNRRREEQRQRFLQQQHGRYNGADSDTTVESSMSSTPAVSQQSEEEAVAQIIEMGFEPEEVYKAMRACLNDHYKAVEYLLNDAPENVDNEPVQAERDNHAPVYKAPSAEGLTTSQTLSQGPSDGQITATSELSYLQMPKEESPIRSTREQDKATCEILYQRKKYL
ncbi:uncharacterized protein LOC123526334 isoform X2 [Mercenaria mercenaria]|uniref:uncharacterized protein LOC123526334 isoform X2 n=1 Tax=Mercenaria mercenaria TaxID=6596 RepID=UPI001E1D2A4E|nr:uncharacterized protein LOC123526334 isoform X2 [Mercenaria mercenaria]